MSEQTPSMAEQIDWSNDEAVVRAAVSAAGSPKYIFPAPTDWALKRRDPLVQAFEREHNPTSARTTTAEAGQLPPLDITPEERENAKEQAQWDHAQGGPCQRDWEYQAEIYCRERQLLAAEQQIATLRTQVEALTRERCMYAKTFKCPDSADQIYDAILKKVFESEAAEAEVQRLREQLSKAEGERDQLYRENRSRELERQAQNEHIRNLRRELSKATGESA